MPVSCADMSMRRVFPFFGVVVRPAFCAGPVTRAAEPTQRGAADGGLGGGVHARAQRFEGGLGLGLDQAPNPRPAGGRLAG